MTQSFTMLSRTTGMTDRTLPAVVAACALSGCETGGETGESQVPPPPLEYRVELTDPLGALHVADPTGLHVYTLVGSDCTESKWIAPSYEIAPEPDFSFRLGWVGSQVSLHPFFSSINWDQFARLSGGVLTVVDVSDDRVEASVSEGQVCDRVDAVHEETCVPQEQDAVILVVGPVEAGWQMNDGYKHQGYAGMGFDEDTGEPVCGRWSAPD